MPEQNSSFTCHLCQHDTKTEHIDTPSSMHICHQRNTVEEAYQYGSFLVNLVGHVVVHPEGFSSLQKQQMGANTDTTSY
ncbi:hypothetical protein CEXT_74401 [Caerostris extrusa]|uniref:Uncharacterized protein n=1 Tax=Caerostris extrusa TaxID=172846 RepID=A0AAV4VEF8_CAEEX|nr:hypothetical protein CEXT_74401 [Caerostris extrusa]